MMGRPQVKRVTYAAQGGALLVALALTGALVMGAPGAGGVSHRAVEITPVQLGGAEASSATPRAVPDQSKVDFEGIATRLALVKNAPAPVEAPAIDPVAQEIQDPTGVVGTTGEIKYLGMITVGLSRSALLNIDGVQKVVPQGRSVTVSGTEITVRSVQGDYVIIADGRAPRRIEKAERSSSAVTMIDTPAPSVDKSARAGQPSADAGRGRAPVDTSGVTPREDFEQRRRDAIQRALSEGRISEEEANRMLERLNRLQDARSGEDNR